MTLLLQLKSKPEILIHVPAPARAGDI